MSIVHRAICQDRENGYEPAALITTTYGLRLLEKALAAYRPEFDEATLCATLQHTCKVNTELPLRETHHAS